MDFFSVVGLPRKSTLPVILLENNPFANEKVAIGTKNAQASKDINGKISTKKSVMIVNAAISVERKKIIITIINVTRRRINLKIIFSFLENNPETMNPIAMLICARNARLRRSEVIISEAWF
jgi:hypothetical protein